MIGYMLIFDEYVFQYKVIRELKVSLAGRR